MPHAVVGGASAPRQPAAALRPGRGVVELIDTPARGLMPTPSGEVIRFGRSAREELVRAGVDLASAGALDGASKATSERHQRTQPARQPFAPRNTAPTKTTQPPLDDGKARQSDRAPDPRSSLTHLRVVSGGEASRSRAERWRLKWPRRSRVAMETPRSGAAKIAALLEPSCPHSEVPPVLLFASALGGSGDSARETTHQEQAPASSTVYSSGQRLSSPVGGDSSERSSKISQTDSGADAPVSEPVRRLLGSPACALDTVGRGASAAGEPATAFRLGRGVVELVVVIEG
jgi:hypothetical protein